MIIMNWIPIGLNWTILFKCLEMTIVVIWRYINKTELNWIESTGVIVIHLQRRSEWRQSRIKCNLAVQIAVAFKKIRYVFDSVPHSKVAWFWFEKMADSMRLVLFTLSKANQIWVTYEWKKSDSRHLQLQWCEWCEIDWN